MASKLQLDVDVEVQGLNDLDKAADGVDRISDSSSKLGAVGTGVFQGMGQAVAGFGLSMAQAGIDAGLQAIGNSISLASDKAEAASKVNVLYGDSAALIEENSRSAAETVGMSSGAYLDAAGTLGNLLTNFDITGAAAADMSTEMIQLAADVGSFNNANPDEVVQAMGAAFRGETEPIRRFGVMLDAASVSAKAVELGLADSTKEVTAGAKAQATYALILEQTASAQGDFARTADGLANSQRIASAKIDEALTTLGEKLMPVVADLVPLLADGLVGAIDLVSGILDDLAPAIDLVVGALKFLVDAVGATVDLFHDLHRAVDPYMAQMEDAQTEFVELGRAAGLSEEQISAGWAEIAAAARNGALDSSTSIAQLTDAFVESERQAAAMAVGVELAADRAITKAGAIGASADEMANAYATAGERIPAIVQQVADDSNLAEALRDRTVDGMPEAARAIGHALQLQLNSAAVRGAALDAARAIGEMTTEQMADGLVDRTHDLLDAADQLVDVLKNRLTPEAQAVRLIGKKYTTAVAEGVASGDPEIIRASLGIAVSAINTIEDGGLKGAKGKRGLEAIGVYYDSLLASGMTAAEAVALAAGGVAEATIAKLEGKENAFTTQGDNIADAWIDGLVGGISRRDHLVNRAVATATRAMQGMSPPKVGPLRHVDESGANVFDAWVMGGIGALRRGRAQIDGALGSLLSGSSALGGAPVQLAGVGGGSSSGGVVVDIYSGVGDTVAIGQEVSQALKAYQRASGTET